MSSEAFMALWFTLWVGIWAMATIEDVVRERIKGG